MKGSKRRSRNSFGSQDSIKDVGHKIKPQNDSVSESIEMKPLVTYIKFINKYVKPFVYTQRPEGNDGSMRSSRNSSGSHGSIKDMGLQHTTNPPSDSDSESIEVTDIFIIQ